MGPPLSSETVVKRSEAILFARLDDELLAIDAQQRFLYSLNESGGRVWAAIAEPTLVRDVCAQLIEAYEVDQDTCQRAVIDLLNQLCEAGLAEVVSDRR